MSVWHMPVATMRIKTSSGRGSSKMRVSTWNGPPFLRTTAAVISRVCVLGLSVICYSFMRDRHRIG